MAISKISDIGNGQSQTTEDPSQLALDVVTWGARHGNQEMIAELIRRIQSGEIKKYAPGQPHDSRGRFASGGFRANPDLELGQVKLPDGVNLDKPTYTSADLVRLVDLDNARAEAYMNARSRVAPSDKWNEEQIIAKDPEYLAVSQAYLNDPLVARVGAFQSAYGGTMREHAVLARNGVMPEQGNEHYELSPAADEVPRAMREGVRMNSGDPKDAPKSEVWYSDIGDAKEFEAAYERGYRHMTRAEDMAAAAHELNDFVTNHADPAIRISSVRLQDVLDNGRFKTSFETGQREKAAGLIYNGYLDRRAAVENLWYGYGDQTPASDRPVYGFIRNRDGSNMTMLQGYGDTEVILKPSILSRTTMTIGDSLNSFANVSPVRFGAKTFETGTTQRPGIGQKAAAYKAGSGKNYFTTGVHNRNNFVEAQYHGGIKLTDIQKVIIHRDKPQQALIAKLTKAGIPFEIQPTEPPLPKD